MRTYQVEEDQEEIHGPEAEESVGLWDIGLFLQVVKDLVFGELSENGQ